MGLVREAGEGVWAEGGLLPDSWLLGSLFEASRADDVEGGGMMVGAVAVPGMLVSELRADILREAGRPQICNFCGGEQGRNSCHHYMSASSGSMQ